MLVSAVLFAVQIFCDFSGYSDIAIGTARLLGVKLRRNFNSPYVALSVRDFWRRWHISLSTWFRDYVYIPLGGSRVTLLRGLVNVMVVFVVSGIWHGANWTFVVWGALHGAALAIEILWRRVVGTVPRALSALGWLWTTAIVLVGWIYFRADSVEGANAMVAALCGVPSATELRTLFTHSTPQEALLTAGLLALLALDHVLRLPRQRRGAGGTAAGGAALRRRRGDGPRDLVLGGVG